MTLDSEMRGVLARLELISHGSVQAWNPAGGRGRQDALYPPGDPRPPHIVFRELYDAAGSDEKRRGVIGAARAELESWTRRTARVEASVSLEDLIIEKGVGWDAESVALSLRCNVRRVRKTRRERARDELGYLLEAPAAVLAVLLAAEGLPQVVIARRLGVSQPTVSRMLRFRRGRREESAA